VLGALCVTLLTWIAWVFLLIGVGVLLFLRALSLVPFGIDVALASVVLSVTVEATPPGSWQVTHVAGRASRTAASAALLAHSDIYNDEDALEAIAKFLRDNRLVIRSAS
jgi:hypothetical protein